MREKSACWLESVFLESCQGIQNPEKKDGKEGRCIFLLTHSLSLDSFLLSLDTVPQCVQLKDHENINAKGNLTDLFLILSLRGFSSVDFFL